MRPDAKGLPSVTTWRVMGRGELAAAERVTWQTGRGPVSRTTAPAAPPPSAERAQGSPGEQAQRLRRECPAMTWLALEPVTGRTHQLRVHCAAMGWPIVGDAIYGTAPRFDGPGLHLHAREVVVPMAKNRAPVRVTAPVPPHMRAQLIACGWNGNT